MRGGGDLGELKFYVCRGPWVTRRRHGWGRRGERELERGGGRDGVNLKPCNLLIIKVNGQKIFSFFILERFGRSVM